jgi:predicted O-methyltransferase YrrM
MIINKYNRQIIKILIKVFSPVKVRHSELSLLLSADDTSFLPSERLLNLTGDALKAMENIVLDDIGLRTEDAKKYLSVWPGEHYKLLASITKVLNPKVVIEIGTATGLSALVIKKYLSSDAKIATFDVIGWQDYPGKCLNENDFLDGKLEQYVDDLSREETVLKYSSLLQEADLIFIDAEKNGIMEKRFLDNLKLVNFKNEPIVIFDDIRLWNMLEIWRNITMPKLDITSFGHWSGTGLIDWKSKI